MKITLSDTQAKDFALQIKDGIRSYIEANYTAYVEWLRTQTDAEAVAELREIEAKEVRLCKTNP